MKLKKKVAIVTGASRGIGRAIALRLAREGAEIVISYQGDARAAEGAVEMIIEAGGVGRAIQADGSDLAQIERFFEAVASTYPQIDILVNNVGTASTKPQPLGTVDVAEYDRLFNLNTRGLFFTTQTALTDAQWRSNCEHLQRRFALDGTWAFGLCRNQRSNRSIHPWMGSGTWKQGNHRKQRFAGCRRDRAIERESFSRSTGVVRQDDSSSSDRATG